MKKRNWLRSLGVAAVVLVTWGGVHAQNYPTKTINLIVPWAAGGSTDQRQKHQKLCRRWHGHRG